MSNENIKIIGISAYYHDSAACLLINGEIIAAAQEERFTRKKHDPSFPINSIKYCLKESNLSLSEIDIIVFYEKPFLKFERILETYLLFAPKGLLLFLTSITTWIKEKLFLKKLIIKELKKINKKIPEILFSEHHLSHAASAFYPSSFSKAAILTIDGVGEWTTTALFIGDKNKITPLKEIQFPHSLGLLYSAFTYFLGFKVNSGEYKLMGLAPYGNPNSPNIKIYKEKIYQELIDIKEDGSFMLNQKYFKYGFGLKMINSKKWEKLFNIKTRNEDSDISQEHSDLALAIQEVTEEIVIKLVQHIKKITDAEYLCLAGGVALNCVSNSKILNLNLFKDVWIQPASGDAGGALGAAYAVYFIYKNNQRELNKEFYDSMRGSYLGPSFKEWQIEKMCYKYKAIFNIYKNTDLLCQDVANIIVSENIVGWFQGRMEWGPRALGNRSILGDSRNKEIQKKLNLKIKFREGFRPFAPSVLYEDMKQFFEFNKISPYMLFTAPVKKERRIEIPKDYHNKTWKEKLYFERSDMPSITHIDYSARLQTVHQESNPLYTKLLLAFKKITGYSVIINTSFNVRGEPIVCTPEDAYKCFMRTKMDYLIIENYLFKKEDQPPYKEKNKITYDD